MFIDASALTALLTKEKRRARIAGAHPANPARLNFSDCFAYACARHYGQPLMFKGADFSRTDIEAA